MMEDGRKERGRKDIGREGGREGRKGGEEGRGGRERGEEGRGGREGRKEERGKERRIEGGRAAVSVSTLLILKRESCPTPPVSRK